MLPASAPPALHSYAPTPALAAVRALRWISKRPVVLRINRVGQYAAVLTRGGIVEDSPVTSPIIVERFAFGWQPVEILYNDCRVKALANRAGVTAVRRLMPGQFIPAVKHSFIALGLDGAL